jgi:amidase
MTQLFRFSALTLAGMIARKEVSSREVIDAHLDRIAAVNPKLNAVVRVLADDARTAADAADKTVASGRKLGSLHGVPITVKENIDMAGLPTTQGVPAFAKAVAPIDAPVVERMRAAGAIPIGRTNLPDFAFRVHTESSLYGVTKNPWHPKRTTAGSSGGEGAAIASGMSPLGLGNDIGGSLRNPANACGISSIRPSFGRVPMAIATMPGNRGMAAQIMAVEGPMARHIADVRGGLRILAGAHPRDPWSVDVPFEGPPAPRRVAVVEAPPGAPTHPAISAAVRAAAGALAGAGYQVEAIVPPRYEEAVEVWRLYIMGDLDDAMNLMKPMMCKGGRDFLDASRVSTPMIETVSAMSAIYGQRDAIAREWSMFMAETPLVLSPCWTDLPFEHGFDAATPANAPRTLEIMRPVVPANLLGLPSACTPAGRDKETGLPIGVLLTGPRMREDLCLDAAEAVEARLGLATPIDPVW